MARASARVLREGLVGGLAGYAAVVTFFVLWNAIAGLPILSTPARLGSALFGPAGSADIGSVLAYNGLHLLVSLAVGWVAAWLVFEVEIHRSLWYVVFFILMAAAIYSVVALGVFGAEILGVVGWGQIVLGNGLWGATILGYLAWRHRGIVGRIEEAEEEEAA